MTLLFLMIGISMAGDDCDRLDRLQKEVQKHGELFVAATRNDTDEEIQEYLDRKYAECKAETELENSPPQPNMIDIYPADE